MFVDLLHRLREQGHDVAFAEKTSQDLDMDVKRVAAHVKSSVADVWLVCAGSREILDWFAGRTEPSFALSGRLSGLLIAGINAQKISAMEARLYLAAQQHLARRGIIAPRDVSLICDDPDVAFSWCLPVVSHFHWDTRPVVSCVVRWVENVASGKEDLRQSFVKAKFVEGGTIGSVAGRRSGCEVTQPARARQSSRRVAFTVLRW